VIESPIIFLHIPKTGGMTFSALAARQFPQAAVHRINGRLAAGRAELMALPEERRRGIRYVYGHVPFGLHECLPRPAVYVTLLRDPVDRIVSIYYYARRRPEWGLHRQIVEQQLSLDDFVASDAAAEFHDQQTRMLSGVDEPLGAAQSLETARRNLSERFALAAPAQRFDEAVLLCRRLFGWRNVFYARANVNRHRPRLDEIPRATIAAIERKNLLDLELYGIVRRRFDELANDDATLAGDLRRFRRINALYGSLGALFAVPFNIGRNCRAAISRARMGHAVGNR
jgi:galactose-3-O-sulfotransferase